MSYTPTQIGGSLTAYDAVSGLGFGNAVALSANGLVMTVGAPNRTASFSGQGGVYTYNWSGSAWALSGSVLGASDAAANDHFGSTVDVVSIASVGGSVQQYLVVGSPSKGNGYVYTYYWNGSAWTQATTATSITGGGSSETFGQGVALSGNGLVLAVGAPNYTGGFANQGRVLIYDRSGSNGSMVWTLRGSALLEPSGAAAGNRFGVDVSLNYDGSVLAVGCFYRTVSLTNEGVVYTFDWNGSSWLQRGTYLRATGPLSSGFFGINVALSSDPAQTGPSSSTKLAVGFRGYSGTYASQGCTQFFDLSGSAWVFRNQLVNSNTSASDYFSFVGLNGAGTVSAIGHNLIGVSGTPQGWVDVYALEQTALPGGASAVSAPKVTLSGAGGLGTIISGALTLPKPSVLGTSTGPALILTGAIVLPVSVVTGGYPAAGIIASGALSAPPVSVSGAGGMQSCSITAPMPFTTGVVNTTVLGTGSIQLPRVTTTGEGQLSILASAAIRVKKPVVSGVAVIGGYAQSALVLPKAKAAGIGSIGVAGSAAIMVPMVHTAGFGFQRLTASIGHSIRMPMPYVQGLRL